MTSYDTLLAANAPGWAIADALEEEGRTELAELYRVPRLPYDMWRGINLGELLEAFQYAIGMVNALIGEVVAPAVDEIARAFSQAREAGVFESVMAATIASQKARAAQSRMLPSGLPATLFGIPVVKTEKPAPKKRTKRGAGEVKIGKHTFKVANWSIG